RTVVEVGPGPGGLTRALFMEGAARVIAFEVDKRCAPALDMIAARYPGRLKMHFGDALNADWPRLLAAEKAGKATIAANLPYAVATRLLVGWLEADPWPPWYDRMVLMFQKEVADRIVATPGTKTYGRLSVLSQWRTKVRAAMTLPPEVFTPPPKISSAVVEFLTRQHPSPLCSAIVLGKVTAAAFGQRRKMLRTSLKQLVPVPEELLDVAGIAGNLRAEDVSVKDFAQLALVFERSKAGRT
ncbi:MAG: 16S rRNA (adenine(1518)-N(6)/adenine(1519)-N(6))-dimethyltransferase RsmA, partial [Hyphomicrobiaceae bacterium]|nr:16S rRNA (adenine(1518)-N(6)/adenine(1519)-N(6))-dimethyltransferase RsmA [Hyphomicrobiaceae bacterium]